MEAICAEVLIPDPAGSRGTAMESHSIGSQAVAPVAASLSQERELALQIRMTASSLMGIALMERHPVPESPRG